MKSSTFAKIFGYVQFGVMALAQVMGNGLPHGFSGWAGLAASLLAAFGIHAASATDGTK